MSSTNQALVPALDWKEKELCILLKDPTPKIYDLPLDNNSDINRLSILYWQHDKLRSIAEGIEYKKDFLMRRFVEKIQKPFFVKVKAEKRKRKTIKITVPALIIKESWLNLLKKSKIIFKAKHKFPIFCYSNHSLKKRKLYCRINDEEDLKQEFIKEIELVFRNQTGSKINADSFDDYIGDWAQRLFIQTKGVYSFTPKAKQGE